MEETNKQRNIEDVKEEVKGEVCKTMSLIDNQTGEVIKTIVKKPSKEENMDEQFSQVSEHKEPTKRDLIFPWKTNAFVKLYCSEELPPYDSDRFLIYWIKLSKKLHQSTNVVVNRGKTFKQDTPMSKEDMIRYLNITDRTFRAFLKESMEKNIIVRYTIEGDCTRVQYVMNPLYTFNGKNINYYTFELFKHDKHFMDKINPTTLERYDYLTLKLNKTT